MTKRALGIHSENLLPIIKRWLYSDKDIFVRELISNACDAIYKAKRLRNEGELQANDDDFHVHIHIDKPNGILTFTDTGIGMYAEEVEKYIAQIAVSGAEDFVKKYQSNNERDQVIGHFGLGFYSAYMVADKVEIQTLSYKPGAAPVFWSCDGTAEYEIETGNRTTRGTQITLFIGKDNEEYLEKSKIQQILQHYCAFLPYPIYLEGERINTHDPLWINSPSECSKDDYLNFYRYLYPIEKDPLFWIHLNVDYPFHLKGVLYFPSVDPQFRFEKSSVKLFCNRVFVSDNCKDVIPSYLLPLRGVIDGPDIPLNVSRSYLQMDRTVRQIASHISKKVSDALLALYKDERERFLTCWPDLSLVVKIGALEDEKFYDRVKEFIIWKNSNGEWTTVDDYLSRNREKTNNKVFYTLGEHHAPHMLDLYQKRGQEVLCFDSPADSYMVSFMERKLTPTTFQRIDAAVDESLLDKEKEKTILDESGRTEAAKLADFIREKLAAANVDVEAKSLAAQTLPGVILLNEQERRMRDYFRTLSPDQQEKLSMISPKQTFVVNTNNPLMTRLPQLATFHPELAQEIVKEAYDLALLSQREMTPTALNEFISRSYRILEQAVSQTLSKGS